MRAKITMHSTSLPHVFQVEWPVIYQWYSISKKITRSVHCAHEVHKNLQRAAYDTQFAHPWPTFKILWMLKNSPSWDTQLGLNNFIFVHMQDNGNYIKPSYFLHQLWQQQITITYWRSFKNMNYAYISSKRKSTNTVNRNKYEQLKQTTYCSSHMTRWTNLCFDCLKQEKHTQQICIPPDIWL